MDKMTYLDVYQDKTDECFKYIDGMNQYKICRLVREHIEAVLEGMEIEICDLALYGSRSRGVESEYSDIDIVMEYEGDFKEDYIFSVLSAEPMYIGGCKVDINPINSDISSYLKEADLYLKKKIEEKNGITTPKKKKSR